MAEFPKQYRSQVIDGYTISTIVLDGGRGRAESVVFDPAENPVWDRPSVGMDPDKTHADAIERLRLYLEELAAKPEPVGGLQVGNVVVFDPSEFPFLGLDAGMEREELTVTAVQAERWHGVAQIRVEWQGREFALLENAVTLV